MIRVKKYMWPVWYIWGWTSGFDWCKLVEFDGTYTTHVYRGIYCPFRSFFPNSLLWDKFFPQRIKSRRVAEGVQGWSEDPPRNYFEFINQKIAFSRPFSPFLMKNISLNVYKQKIFLPILRIVIFKIANSIRHLEKITIRVWFSKKLNTILIRFHNPVIRF